MLFNKEWYADTNESQITDFKWFMSLRSATKQTSVTQDSAYFLIKNSTQKRNNSELQTFKGSYHYLEPANKPVTQDAAYFPIKNGMQTRQLEALMCLLKHRVKLLNYHLPSND